MNEVLKMMINAVKGISSGEFSKAEMSESIRNALIEINGGSKKITPKNFYRGSELFALVEELIPVIVEEGFKDDDEIFKFVEYKNIKDGDVNEFHTEGKLYFVVADAAAGIKGVRRQRLDGMQTVSVQTSVKIIRVYEELNRLLAGRVTFDTFVQAVADAFKQKMLADAYAAISTITANTAGMEADLVVSGTYSEDDLNDLCDKVEARTGYTPVIYGTKAALRKVTTAVVSDQAKEDVYGMGYYGKFNGVPMVALRQSYKPGTSTFNIDNNKLYILAGNSQPIKFVNEGEGLLIEQEPTANADLTQEYVYGQTYGVGVIVSEQFGVYTMS